MSTLDRRTALLAATTAPFAFVAGRSTAALIPAPTDPLPALVARHRAATEAFIAAANEPDGGDFDTPACLAAAGEREALCEPIAHAIPTTPEAAAAQLEWLDRDSEGMDLGYPLYIIALRNCAAGLRAMEALA